MTTEVVVHDNAILDVVPGERIGYDEAVRRALAERDADPTIRRGSTGRPS